MNKKNNVSKSGNQINPIAAGMAGAAAGAVMGAGVAVVTSAAMKNPNTRKQVDKVVNTVKKQASQYMDQLKNENIKEGKKAVANIAGKAKKSIQANGQNKKVNAGTGSSKVSHRPSTHA